MEIPLHHNSSKKSSTLYWSGLDSKELWIKNRHTSSEFFVDNNWDNEFSITYTYNSHGFRCEEFSDKPVYIALGCSHTEGVGLSSEQTWPYQLSLLLHQPILNMGVGGSSLDTCFRLLNYYIDNLTVLGVFLLVPSDTRLEMFINDTPQTIYPIGENPPIFYKTWISSTHNINNNATKNLYAMEYLCMKKGINMCKYTMSDFTIIHNNHSSFARDMQHHGPKSMKVLATMFSEL